MNAQKKALAPVLGSYVDEGKYTYRIIKQKMLSEEGISFIANKIIRTKDGEIYFEKTSFYKNPSVFDFLKRGLEEINSNSFKSLTFRRNCYRPYFFESEVYELTVVGSKENFKVRGKGYDFKNKKSSIYESLRLLNLPESIQKDIFETKTILLKLRIQEQSPTRISLDNYFKTKFYVDQLLDPEKLWNSISLKDIRLERLELFGVKIKAKDATNDLILENKNKHWRRSNFGVKNVLQLENIVECFPKGISNEKLLSEGPNDEAGVYLAWHNLTQMLVSQNKPLILI